MPFKSEAQRRLFYAKMHKGEIAPEVVREWQESTHGPLPEHVKKAGAALFAALKGGKAEGMSPDEFRADQMAIGRKIEREHTNKPQVAERIAMDHLEEIPDYYTWLPKMEAEAKKAAEAFTAQTELPRGDLSQPAMIRNPYELTDAQQAAEFENGYQYAQTLGPDGIRAREPGAWDSQAAAWKEGFEDGAKSMGVIDAFKEAARFFLDPERDQQLAAQRSTRGNARTQKLPVVKPT
jgi:hypothetical protein